VEAASRLFRLRGVDAVGIADLMKDVGLTHGGFYNHFPSKEALAVEVFDTAFANSLGRLAATVRRGPDGSQSPLERVVDGYLSAAHRDAGDGGCPSASLVTDAWRQSGHVQAAPTQRGSKATSPGSPRRSLAKQLRRVRTSTLPKSARKPSDY
jgi:TetR/AcrR family transcriptional regulator, transcriptional repressor for nem operon